MASTKNTPLLEIGTECSGTFKTLIEILKDIVPEANIDCYYDERRKKEKKKKLSDGTEDDDEDEVEDDEPNKKSRSGMRIMAVDTTHTVLINIKLDAKNFTKFKCLKSKHTLGVNFNAFYKCIRSMDKSDILTLRVDHDDRNTLQIKIDNPDDNKESTLKLKLLDLSDNKMQVPDIHFESVITISSQEFHRVCREMAPIAEYVEIKCLKDKFILTCKGESAERETIFKTDSTSGKNVGIKHASSDKNGPQIVQGVYDLKNIVLFSKCVSFCPAIEIYMKNEHPLVIKYTVSTLGRALLCLTPILDDVAKNNYSEEDEYYSDEDVQYIDKKKAEKAST